MAEMGDAEARKQVVEELGVLHRSRGLRRSRLAGHVGPRLRQLLDIAPDADESSLRRALVDGLITAARALPGDLRVAFLYASAVSSKRRLLQERLGEAGAVIDRDPRTVRRRLEQANVGVARELLARREWRANHPLAPTGWTVVMVASSLDLRADRPRFTIDKSILAGQRMSVVTESVSIPRPGGDADQPDIEIAVLTGGTLINVERVGASAWRYQIDLGCVLDSGDSHDLRIQVTVPSHQHVLPFNAVVPLRPCGHFSCRVEFDPARLPREIRRIDGLHSGALGDRIGASGSAIEPASVVAAEFSALVTGLAYGLRWAF